MCFYKNFTEIIEMSEGQLERLLLRVILRALHIVLAVLFRCEKNVYKNKLYLCVYKVCRWVENKLNEKFSRMYSDMDVGKVSFSCKFRKNMKKFCLCLLEFLFS